MSSEETATATPKSQRRRRSSTGGLRHKLDAPARKGYIRRWVDNDPSRIMAMEELGYAMVGEKAGEDAARTEGMGSRIQRHGGKRDDGSPQALVLMECREDDYRLGIQDKEEALAPFEAALKRGADTTGRMTDSYSPQSGKSSISHTS